MGRIRKTYAITLDPSVADEAKKFAYKERRTFSSLIEVALIKLIESNKSDIHLPSSQQ